MEAQRAFHVACYAALAGVFACVAGPATSARADARSAARMTLAEFARERATQHVAPPKLVPHAVMAQLATFRYRQPFSNFYLLYVSAIEPNGNGVVNVYPGWISGQHPPLIEQFTGLDTPTGLAVDTSGTLYVCQTDIGAPVLAFRLGATTPSLKLDTQGTLPVAVAVSPRGTVFVSTAATSSHAPEILAYPRGATRATARYTNLAGDAVAALQSDRLGNLYFAADFIGYGNYVGQITAAAVKRQVLRFEHPVTALAVDRSGNVAVRADDKLRVYARHMGALLRVLDSAFAQALALDSGDAAFYTAAGTIEKRAYQSGALLDTITSLADDNTFGLATFPAAPYGEPW